MYRGSLSLVIEDDYDWCDDVDKVEYVAEFDNEDNLTEIKQLILFKSGSVVPMSEVELSNLRELLNWLYKKDYTHVVDCGRLNYWLDNE